MIKVNTVILRLRLLVAACIIFLNLVNKTFKLGIFYYKILSRSGSIVYTVN